MWLDFFVQAKDIKVIVPHVNGHQKVTSTEENFNNQVDRLTHASQSFSSVTLVITCELMNKLATVARMEIVYVQQHEFLLNRADLARAKYARSRDQHCIPNVELNIASHSTAFSYCLMAGQGCFHNGKGRIQFLVAQALFPGIDLLSLHIKLLQKYHLCITHIITSDQGTHSKAKKARQKAPPHGINQYNYFPYYSEAVGLTERWNCLSTVQLQHQ